MQEDCDSVENRKIVLVLIYLYTQIRLLQKNRLDVFYESIFQ